MPTVVAAVVRRGRAFSSVVAARVAGDVGGRCDGPPRPFGCRAVMIVHARAAVSAWWGPLVSGRCSRLQLMRTVHGFRGAWLPRIYKSKERERRIPLPCHLASLPFTSCLRFLAVRPFVFAQCPLHLCAPPPTSMAPPNQSR
jgi:hypothetical protein